MARLAWKLPLARRQRLGARAGVHKEEQDQRFHIDLAANGRKSSGMTTAPSTGPSVWQRQARREWRARATIEELVADTELLQRQALAWLRFGAAAVVVSGLAALVALALSMQR
jgi:hypothetical protein